MNNNRNRQSSIVTPAQRKAEQERKARAAEKSTAPKAPAVTPSAKAPIRTAEERRRDIENRRTGNTTVAPAPAPVTRPATARTADSGKAGSAHTESGNSLQQQLLEQQRKIEMLQNQLRAEKEEKSKSSAQHSRLRELERKIEHQKLVNEEYLEEKDIEMSAEKKKNIKTAVIAAVVVLVIANIIVFSKITTKTIPQKQPDSDAVTEQTQQTTESTESINSQSEADIPVIDPKTETVSVLSSDYQLGITSLINAEYEYNFNNVGSDITNGELVVVASKILNKTYKAADYKIYLNNEVVDMLNIMMADFYAYSGKTDVMVNTAHRSLEQQQSIFDAKVAQLGPDQQIAQKPGKSEHHTGYAFDLAIYPPNTNGSTFINAAPYTWIYENCHKYGFVLRYPEGKTPITGISPESWHFRYVGIPHATYMYTKNKTLEEYITDISIYSESIPLTIDVSETESYSVFYVEKSTGARTEFNIPRNTEYKISGDNVGGFIVWYNNDDVGKKGSIAVSAPAADTPEATTDTTTTN